VREREPHSQLHSQPHSQLHSQLHNQHTQTLQSQASRVLAVQPAAQPAAQLELRRFVFLSMYRFSNAYRIHQASVVFVAVEKEQFCLDGR